MSDGVVESKEEMKRKMERMKKGESPEKGQIEKVKEGASEKKEDIKDKASEIKEGISEKKEDMSENIEEIKDEVSEKKEEIKDKAGEVKEEVADQKKQIEKESKDEERSPAEKLLNEIVSGFRQRTGEVNEAISDYTTKPEASEASKKPKKVLKPLVDVLETNDTITIIADLPGVKKDDIDIGISKNSVEITAMFKEEPEDAKFTQKERSYGKTHRSIKLSTEIKVKEAKAKYGDYTVTITLPKLVEDITKVNIEE